MPPFVRNCVTERHAFVSDGRAFNDSYCTGRSCVGYDFQLHFSVDEQSRVNIDREVLQ
jgi:hypothetical protein